jgi:hypothetical protein
MKHLLLMIKLMGLYYLCYITNNRKCSSARLQRPQNPEDHNSHFHCCEGNLRLHIGNIQFYLIKVLFILLLTFFSNSLTLQVLHIIFTENTDRYRRRDVNIISYLALMIISCVLWRQVLLVGGSSQR